MMDKQSGAYKRKKEIGQFFTDDNLVEKIIKCFSLSFKDKVIVEPSCGKGAFISGIIATQDRYDKIIGIDIDNTALSQNKYDCNNISLINDDYLLISNTIKNVDMIIGNPPFNVKVDGFVDSMEAFMVHAIECVKDGGEIIFVMPHTVLRTQKYQKLREKIIKETCIVGIMDTCIVEFSGADIETVVMYLKKEKVNKQKYTYFDGEKSSTIEYEDNPRYTIFTRQLMFYKLISKQLGDVTLGDLFYVRRGRCKNNGLRGKEIDFYDDVLTDRIHKEYFIGIQNIAYRITANVICGDIDKVSDTVTMLIPKGKMSLEELRFVVNFLNSSIVFYTLHTYCLNNCRLTIHIDKYYIDDIKIPNFKTSKLGTLIKSIEGNKKSTRIVKARDSFFYQLLEFNNSIIDEVEKFWVAPKFKFKGVNNNNVRLSV